MAEPSFNEFDPNDIPWQYDVINLIFEEWDYAKDGRLEILLSGGLGSAKSIVMAHVATRIAYMYHGARVLIGRRSFKDIKSTIYSTIRAHMEGTFIEKHHFKAADNTAKVTFRPGTEKRSGKIFGRSWGDKNYKNVRSLSLTAAVIEELTENSEKDMEAISEITKRIGRTTHIPISLLLCATNPDSPQHWVYKRFLDGAQPVEGKRYLVNPDFPNRITFKSRAADNPFLADGYILSLMRDMPEKEIQRMLNGEWVEIDGSGIYYEYRQDRQFFRNSDYEIDPSLPILWGWDFNIGAGKPMSCVFLQYNPATDTFHAFDEIVVETLRTADICEEAWNRGLINPNFRYFVGGDRNGNNRDTRGTRTDFEIIERFLHDKGVDFTRGVPAKNPPVRERHNRVNAYCKNGLGEVRLFLYRKCKVLDEGLRLTALLDRAEFLEDDSKFYQHVTTALGYVMDFYLKKRKSQGGVVIL